MAEKRMFSMKILGSDAFLDLPLTTQALYLHLCMRADDDGFLNNAKAVTRLIGATEKDLKTLIEKRFILSFKSGVIVIKHWKIHNTIRKDRQHGTQYSDEMATLKTKENGSYTEIDNQVTTNCQPNDNQMTTKCLTSECQMATENSIEENSIEQNREDYYTSSPSGAVSRLNADKVLEIYNEICSDYFPKANRLTEKRKQAIRKITKQYTEEQIREIFTKASNTAFLKGESESGWKADFDWLINENNIVKLLEGKYDGRRKTQHTDPPKPEPIDTYDLPDFVARAEDY